MKKIFCDNCKKEIDLDNNENYFQVEIHGEATTYYIDSYVWADLCDICFRNLTCNLEGRRRINLNN